MIAPDRYLALRSQTAGEHARRDRWGVLMFDAPTRARCYGMEPLPRDRGLGMSSKLCPAHFPGRHRGTS